MFQALAAEEPTIMKYLKRFIAVAPIASIAQQNSVLLSIYNDIGMDKYYEKKNEFEIFTSAPSQIV